jgi:hypothetical protein
MPVPERTRVSPYFQQSSTTRPSRRCGKSTRPPRVPWARRRVPGSRPRGLRRGVARRPALAVPRHPPPVEHRRRPHLAARCCACSPLRLASTSVCASRSWSTMASASGSALPPRPGRSSGQSRMGLSTKMACTSLGPCTPRVSVSSMSAVRLGPGDEVDDGAGRLVLRSARRARLRAARRPAPATPRAPSDRTRPRGTRASSEVERGRPTPERRIIVPVSARPRPRR